MTKTANPLLLDLRQGEVDSDIARTPNIPLPYIVEIETRTMGLLSLMQCGLSGDIFVRQLDGFSISVTELKRAGFEREADYLTEQFIHRATSLRIDYLKAEIVKLEKFLETKGEPTRDFIL